MHAGAGAPVMDIVAMAAFTAIFNITGQPADQPALARGLPPGLPVGVQIVAGPWREAQLCGWPPSSRQADPWAHRYPRFD